MNIHKVNNFFMKLFRPKRAREIKEHFPILFDSNARVLDVGGGRYPWELIDHAAHITILNVNRPQAVPENAKLTFVVGDGTNLRYSDQSFDLVFSNSVIEHVGDWDSQCRFAKELLRVGKRLYCQTPNKWFPIEPHLITAFLHWLPYPIARKIVRFGSIWGLVTKPGQTQVDEFLASIRLLSFREVKELFPHCRIRREKVFGMTKSFIVERLEVPGEVGIGSP